MSARSIFRRLFIDPNTVSKGKTKQIIAFEQDSYEGKVINFDRVTWGNEHKMPLPGKGAWSAQTNINTSNFLARHKIPIAYLGAVAQQNHIFVTRLCHMFPFEVVATGEVDEASSFRKRHPNYPVGTVLAEPVISFFLKTTGKKYLKYDLPCDDPLMAFGKDGSVGIYLPNRAVADQRPIFVVSATEALKIFPGFKHIDELDVLAGRIFTLLRNRYTELGATLKDLKVEFGAARDPALHSKVLLADVIDADSVRLTFEGRRADKQPIRNGGQAARQEQIDAYLLALHLSSQLNAGF